MKYKLNPTGFLMNIKGSSGLTIKKLNTFDWLCDLPEAQSATDFVEVQFKNTRKGYYLNSNKLQLQKGDMVAVEASPGHDIGMVTLTGQLVLKQMKKTRYRFGQEVKRVYRKARPVDLEKYEESKAKEHETMIRSRQIAKDLGLDMKIGDVEYQGDGNKAIFYYIADGRVDFRELIKVLADVFHIRIEMKQIGARQEAGRIGGIGPCGREMCCSSWMTNFVSVSTSAARYQDLSLNPQKLAGQCAKLKCCMNFETDMYVEAQKNFPSKDICLETMEGTWFPVKNDLFKKTITYSTSKDTMANLQSISLERVWQIIKMNQRGEKPDLLTGTVTVKEQSAFGDILGDDYTRFDRQKNRRNKHHGDRRDRPREQQGRQGQQQGNQPQGDRNPRNDRNDRKPRNERPNQQGQQNQQRQQNQQGQNRPNQKDRPQRPNRPQQQQQPQQNRPERKERPQQQSHPQQQNRSEQSES